MKFQEEDKEKIEEYEEFRKEEDKEKIEEYEEFRKMPEKIREEVMLYRKRNKSQDTKIDFNLKEVILRGEVDENDNLTAYEKKKNFSFHNLKLMKKGIFWNCVKI